MAGNSPCSPQIPPARSQGESRQQISPCIRFSLAFCASTSICRGRRQGQKTQQAHAQQKRQQPSSRELFSAASPGPGREAPRFPFPHRSHRLTRAQKHLQSNVLGCPRWDSRPHCLWLFPKPVQTPRQPRQDPQSPCGSPGAGRITAGPRAAPGQAGPCRWLGSGPGYLQGRAMHRRCPKPPGDCCQPRLMETAQRGEGSPPHHPRLLQCPLLSPAFTHTEHLQSLRSQLII